MAQHDSHLTSAAAVLGRLRRPAARTGLQTLVQRAKQRLTARLLVWVRRHAPQVNSLNQLLSTVYGQPMQVLPRSQSGLAGAVVLWYLQDGFKQFIMIRSAAPENLAAGAATPEKATAEAEAEQRSRFVSCLGQGRHVTLAGALKAVLETQLGPVFTRTLGESLLAPDRVAAAPVFTYTDDTSGISYPVQALVWVAHIQAAQAELIEVAPGLEVVTVPEFALSSHKVSATHRALWQAVQRHIPKSRLAREGQPSDDAARDETLKDLVTSTPTPRVLH